MFIRQPRALRYTIVAKDGQVYDGVNGQGIVKVLEKPAGFQKPVAVFECKHPTTGLWVRLWPEDIADVHGEPIE